MVKVSLIMPVYNNENHLENALDSIVSQTFTDFEVLCVDDGSSDNSPEILKSYANDDSRIKIISQENSGPGHARNNGLRQSSGEYIFFMDSDDWIVPDFLKLTYENAISNDSDILFFKIGNIVNGENVELKPYYNFDEIFKDANFNNLTFNYKSIRKHVMNSHFAPWTKLYKKEFLDRYEDFEFDEKLPYEDVLFHIKATLRSSKISFVPHYLYYYRLDNEDSVSYDASLHKEIFKIVDIVRDFLINENHLDEFKKEFEYFKVEQITRHIPTTADRDYFRNAKDYLNDVDLDENNLIPNNVKNRYRIFFDSSTIEEYNYNLIIHQLNGEYSKLKKEKEKPHAQSKKSVNSNKKGKKEMMEYFLNKSNSYVHYKNKSEKLLNENEALKNQLEMYKQAYPDKECPICGYKGIDFKPYPQIIHREVECPICASHERHRALWLYFKENPQLLTNKNKVLHFAPEVQFQKLFEKCDIEYHPADISDENWYVDELIDIQDIPYEDNYFDLIYCSHLLEHVPDDNKAIRELYRVLKPGGTALILVPINGIAFELPYDETKTLEDERYDTPELREKHYGQFDHLRLYGSDFKDKLLENGFKIKSDDFIKKLGYETIERYALIRNENIFECTK
ncbi:glycosyltransferase [Methanobrevibacter sp.]|uniref:glycosyltransferase n=1 Tax=Methanobrevibacter sp. TaxID=66852 RepID=UPI00386E4A8B